MLPRLVEQGTRLARVDVRLRLRECVGSHGVCDILISDFQLDSEGRDEFVCAAGQGHSGVPIHTDVLHQPRQRPEQGLMVIIQTPAASDRPRAMANKGCTTASASLTTSAALAAGDADMVRTRGCTSCGRSAERLACPVVGSYRRMATEART